jgi:hypothetical protein
MAAAEEDGENMILFRAKFQGQIIELPPLDANTVRVSDLKRLLQDESSVPVARQKLLGLVKGKLPPDDTTLGDLVKTGIAAKVALLKLSANNELRKKITLKDAHSLHTNELFCHLQGPPYLFSLMGTTDAKLFVDPNDRDDLPEVGGMHKAQTHTLPRPALQQACVFPTAARGCSHGFTHSTLSRQVVDDFGVDFDYDAEAARWHRSSRNARKLREYTAKTEVNWIAARRPGKALLVLDLDHTLLDFTNAREGLVCENVHSARSRQT